MPAASGVPTTAILIGDYSNGNDALLVRNGAQLKDLAGKKMLLVEKTVSEYLFDRAMTMGGLRDQIKKVRMINTSDSDIATAFISDASASAVVTWKPMVSQIAKQKGVTSLFNSSQIPGEILDLDGGADGRVESPGWLGHRNSRRRSRVRGLKCCRRCRRRDPRGTRCWPRLRKGRRTRWHRYKEQLTTTKMFYTPQSAVAFGESPDLKQKMALVRQFCFDHGLLGANTKAVDDVAIRYPDNSVQGKADRVRFVFDLSYMQMAAQGKL